MNKKKLAISFLLVFTLVCSCLVFSQGSISFNKVLSSFASMYAPNGTLPGNRSSMSFGENQISIKNNFTKTEVTYYK